MTNIVRYLSGETFAFSYIVNDFDTKQIKYFDETGTMRDFQDRAAFLNFIQRQGIRFDVLHFHSWHYSDHYKPFKTERDEIGVEVFIEQLGKPKVIYTDHWNPTEDLRRIYDHHGIDYVSLSDEDKEAFLQTHGLGNFGLKYWKRGWDATSILGKRQMMRIADRVTHVSAAQRAEEATFILPNYKTDGKHVVVWNGTDMIPYRNLPYVRERAESLRRKRNGKSVLYVGRAEKEKGIFDLAIAAAKLHVIGAPVSLVFVGSFDKSLRTRLDMTSGQKNVYLGRIDDRAELAAQYIAADLIAQPTWGECFNQVVSEGLAVGTPSVVSDISGPREVYVANGIAIGHQPQAPISLAHGIKRGLNDGTFAVKSPKKGSGLSKSGYRRLVWLNSMQKFIALEAAGVLAQRDVFGAGRAGRARATASSAASRGSSGGRTRRCPTPTRPRTCQRHGPAPPVDDVGDRREASDRAHVQAHRRAAPPELSLAVRAPAPQRAIVGDDERGPGSGTVRGQRPWPPADAHLDRRRHVAVVRPGPGEHLAARACAAAQ